MWKIINSELKYFRIAFTAPIFFTILFQIMGFYTLKTISKMNTSLAHSENIDMWGGFYSFVLLFSILSIWQTRIKENRERFFVLLPITNKQQAIGRFWFAVLPITVLIFYFISIHLIISNIWDIELNIALLQIGIIFIIFAGFIRARDDWFSHWNFGKRTQAAFISISIIQIIVVAIFLNLSDTYKNFTPIFGEMFYHYVKIIFFLLGLVIMVTTIFSYQKRKSYLS